MSARSPPENAASLEHTTTATSQRLRTYQLESGRRPKKSLTGPRTWGDCGFRVKAVSYRNLAQAGKGDHGEWFLSLRAAHDRDHEAGDCVAGAGQVCGRAPAVAHQRGHGGSRHGFPRTVPRDAWGRRSADCGHRSGLPFGKSDHHICSVGVDVDEECGERCP